MNDGRRRAAAVLSLVLMTTGCTSTADGEGDGGADPGGGSTTSGSTTSDPDPSVAPAADAAAAAYLEDLERYRRQLTKAAGLTATSFENDSAPQYRAAQRAFRTAVDAAPVLEVVDGGTESSESYARIVDIAESVQGFVAEHEWMTGWDAEEARRVYYVLFEVESDQFNENLRLGTAYSDAMSRPGPSDRTMQRALRTQLTAQLRNAAATRRRIERMAGDDTFTPSLRDHVVHEIDEAVAVGERYLEYVETAAPEAINRDLFRNGFVGGAVVPGGPVADIPLTRAVAARQGLADGVSRLTRAARGGGGDLPTAGDVYRELILGLFSPADTDPSGRDSLAVDEQLYWLWRIKEIEETPDETFENARLTIKLQNVGTRGAALVNTDSRFEELAAISVVLADSVNVPEEGAANKPWIVEMLARPFPDALEEPVAIAREAAGLMPDSADEPASPELIALGDPMFAAVTQAADDLDDPKRFRRIHRAAIDGTRPSPTG